MTEKETDQLDKLSMNILVHAGDARNFMAQALEALEKNWDYEAARNLLKKANQEIIEAHGLQTATLQLEASGKSIRYSTLFSHAQDTLMTSQSEILIAEHLINLFHSKDISH